MSNSREEIGQNTQSSQAVEEMGREMARLSIMVANYQREAEKCLEENSKYKLEMDEIRGALEKERGKNTELLSSTSWRLTYPVRIVGNLLRKLSKS